MLDDLPQVIAAALTSTDAMFAKCWDVNAEFRAAILHAGTAIQEAGFAATSNWFDVKHEFEGGKCHFCYRTATNSL